MPADQFIDYTHGPPALAGFVSKKYTAGLEMLCPGGACFKLGSPAGLNRSKLNAKLM
jgi:hypothetical protein